MASIITSTNDNIAGVDNAQADSEIAGAVQTADSDADALGDVPLPGKIADLFCLDFGDEFIDDATSLSAKLETMALVDHEEKTKAHLAEDKVSYLFILV